MINECLKFSDLCEYYENNIPDQSEIDEIVKHLENCDKCKEEFLRLKSMFEILHDYSCSDVDCKDISDQVIKKLKFRSRRRKMLRGLPAVAAILVFSFSAVFYLDGFNNLNNSIAKSQDSNLTYTEQVIDIINNNNAKLLSVTEKYIEGEIVQSKFNQLRKDLGMRQVTSTLAHKSKIAIRNGWRRGFEAVGAGAKSRSQKSSVKYIRFRVHKQ